MSGSWRGPGRGRPLRPQDKIQCRVRSEASVPQARRHREDMALRVAESVVVVVVAGAETRRRTAGDGAGLKRWRLREQASTRWAGTLIRRTFWSLVRRRSPLP